MSSDLRQSMRLGIVHFMAYPSTGSGSGPILESIDELAADEFFDVVEVTHIQDPSVRAEAAHRIHISGLQVAYGSQPLVLGGKLNLHSRDEAFRRQSLQRITAALEEAAEIGSVGFATMSGPDPGDEFREEETKLFLDSLNQLCECAQHLNPEMNVVVESFDRVPFGKNCLAGPTKEVVEFIQTLRCTHPRFGLMLDLSHLPLLNETPEEAVPIAAPVLAHVHIGNCVMRDNRNPYYGDNHPPFDYPGGENSLDDLVRYFKCLDEIDYFNRENPPIVTAEVKPLSDALRPAILGNVKRTILRALAKLNDE